MNAGAAPPDAVLGYAAQLASELAQVCAGSLRAAYLHGSAALGGWVPGRSDVDILLVAGRRPTARSSTGGTRTVTATC